MNLLDLMETQAPSEIEFVGLVKGKVKVQFALASDLARTVRFGASSFGQGQHLSCRGVELDCAGVCFYETAGEWKLASHGGFRKPGTMADGPHKTVVAMREAMIVHCVRLAEQFPEAFVKPGMSDIYSTMSSARAAAVWLASDADICSRFAEIAEGVDDGNYTLRPLLPGDDAPDKVRWNKPRSRDFTDSSIGCSQPRAVSGLVLDGKIPIGYVVDTRQYEYGAPDCYAGPLLLPMSLAVGVDQKTTSW